MKTKNASCILLLFGMFAQTRIDVIGSIGISELICFLAAPIVFVMNFYRLRRDGLMTYFGFALLTSVGCVISSACNHTPMQSFIRGFASTYALFAYPVVLHKLLRDNLRGIRWYVLGLCISLIINTFAFQSADDIRDYNAAMDSSLTEAVIRGPLFWISRLGSWLMLPINGWYMSVPTIYSALAPIPMVIYTLLDSGSGRSAAIVAACSIAIIIYCRKKISRMVMLQKRLLAFFVGGVMLVFVFKMGYTYAAESGLLGEKSQEKYYLQSKYGTGALGLLVGGRMQTFVGLMACMDRPIVGFGPWAVDTEDYWGRFLLEYGNAEDFTEYQKAMYYQMKKGYGYKVIPAHSQIIGFWLWYGVLGLVFWIYILYLVYQLFRKYLSAIPQWFGYIAINAFSFTWGVFFSPFGNRAELCLFLTCLLLTRAVGQGRISLPWDMRQEALEKEGRYVG